MARWDSRNSETEMGLFGHTETHSTCTHASAHMPTREHTDAPPGHTRPPHPRRLWPCERRRRQPSRTAAGAGRPLPAAPLQRLAQQAAAPAGARRALLRPGPARPGALAGAGRAPGRRERQGVCPRRVRVPEGRGGASAGRGRGVYKVARRPGINKPRLAPSSDYGTHAHPRHSPPRPLAAEPPAKLRGCFCLSLYSLGKPDTLLVPGREGSIARGCCCSFWTALCGPRSCKCVATLWRGRKEGLWGAAAAGMGGGFD